MPYYGECILCGKHVRNGHGRSGQYTYCPPCCVKRNACKPCAGIAVDLDPSRQQPPVVIDDGARDGIDELHRLSDTLRDQPPPATFTSTGNVGGYGVGE